MRFLIQILLFLSLTTLMACNAKVDSDDQFVYSVDKEGVYLYSLRDDSVKSIYTTDRVFLNDQFVFINDSILQVLHQSKLRSEARDRKVYSKYLSIAGGDSTFITDIPPFTVVDNYDFLTDSILYINIKTGESYVARVLDYEHYEHSILKIKTRVFNQAGKLILEKDTVFNCGGITSSPRGIQFCKDRIRYYSKSRTVQGKTIVSDCGDLILIENNKEEVLLKYDGHFDPKFGSGFYNPTLSSDGKKVTYQYLAGFLKRGSCIYEMDIHTKSQQELIGKGFFNPIYSPDNKLLLLFSNNDKLKNNTRIRNIYIFDIESNTKIKLALGNNYLWVRE